MKLGLRKFGLVFFSFLISSNFFWFNPPIIRNQNELFSTQKTISLNINSNTYLTNISPEIDRWVKEKISNLTLEEKVDQMFIFRAVGNVMTSDFENFLKSTKPGGFIFLGENISDSKEFTKKISETNPNLPYFFAVDEEGGEVKRFDADKNPGAKVLDKYGAEDFCKEYEKTTEIIKENGMNLNFGVIADIAWDNKSFIYSRAFSNNPSDVAEKVRLQIKCSKAALTTVKHFPGHGRTSTDSHKTIPVINISYNDWKNSDAIPFQESLKEFPDMVMIGHLKYPKIDNTPATLSKIQIENLRKMGFDGVVITDDMQMLSNSGMNPEDALFKAFDAGNDILLYVTYLIKPEDMIQKIVDRVRKGQISEDRINKSVERILRLKFRL